jgi:hypothetical protein
MAHVQQQILDGVRAAIIAANTAAAGRVFLERVDPLQQSELPAVMVDESPAGEEIEPATISGALLRTLSVLIRCVAMSGSPQAARGLGLAVEEALVDLPYMQVQLTNSVEGDKLFASRDQQWRISVMSPYDDPETIL